MLWRCLIQFYLQPQWQVLLLPHNNQEFQEVIQGLPANVEGAVQANDLRTHIAGWLATWMLFVEAVDYDLELPNDENG